MHDGAATPLGLLTTAWVEKVDTLKATAAEFAAMHTLAMRFRGLLAARNAILETWSNGQTEGQINRSKTLKRAMYGRAGTELLRARMLPLQGS